MATEDQMKEPNTIKVPSEGEVEVSSDMTIEPEEEGPIRVPGDSDISNDSDVISVEDDFADRGKKRIVGKLAKSGTLPGIEEVDLAELEDELNQG